ncbi:hypothetical protein [Kitasatospora purpeofusca]|uniref:hypothetical protein n=1 Tax=Kitasatospora purpeofusca TaxID=67352 RepID=UPI0036D3655C
MALSGLAATAGQATATTTSVCNGRFAYRAHVQDLGWQPWSCNGQWAGTQGLAKNIEAIEFQINPGDQDTFCARAHRTNYGWDSNFVCKTSGNFQIGTTGINSPIEAIQVQPHANGINGNAYSRDVGWLGGMTYEGNKIGTIGTVNQARPMEMFWLNLVYVA